MMKFNILKPVHTAILSLLIVSTCAVAEEQNSADPVETTAYGESIDRTIYAIQDNDGFVYNYLKNISKSDIDSKAEIILVGQNINITPELANQIKNYLDNGKTVIFDGLSTGSKANKNAYSVLKSSINADAIMFKGSMEKNTLSMTPIISGFMLESKVSGGSDANLNTLQNILP